MTLFKKTITFLQIAGLAIITVLLALGIIFFFPKFTNAPIQPAPSADPIAISPVVLDTLSPGDYVRPSQEITGTTPGFWFFEASFPVTLRDINGNDLVTLIAKTDEDWMVTKNVQFSFTLPDTFSYTGPGFIYLKKDDPSDGEAPFNPTTDELTIPVIFENN